MVAEGDLSQEEVAVPLFSFLPQAIKSVKIYVVIILEMDLLL